MLCANMPAQSIARMVQEQKADLLAVSATMSYHVETVVELVTRVRESEAGERVKILVGGPAFNLSPLLWRHVGADGHAPDAKEAVRVAGQLLSEEEKAREDAHDE